MTSMLRTTPQQRLVQQQPQPLRQQQVQVAPQAVMPRFRVVPAQPKQATASLVVKSQPVPYASAHAPQPVTLVPSAGAVTAKPASFTVMESPEDDFKDMPMWL